MVDQRWLNTATSTATDRFQYGYDADNNRLYRDNLVNAAFGELDHAPGSGNGYDSLNRLTDFRRGTLTTTHDDLVGGPSRGQSWSLDALGNWLSVTSDGATSNRDHNAQNQIADIDGTPLSYDNNGNLLQDQAGNVLTYDAWNRLVGMQNAGGTPLAAYSYDALGRRIVEIGTASLDLYFSKDWQVVEERTGGTMQTQSVWSPLYVDALVERDTNGGPRLYAQQDANWNVTALVDVSGAVQERYVYDPYGQATVLAADWTPRGGSSFAWTSLFQGGRFDVNTGMYQFRNRDYGAGLGRWLEQDPAFYVNGMNVYQYEGSNPANYVDPTGLQWIYHQGTGQLTHNGQNVGQGYSGTGDGRNNHDQQGTRNVGPIPTGDYTIGRAHRDPHRGANTMSLTPNGHNALGRDGFLIHGDNARHDASTGCIILPPNVRQSIGGSNDRNLRVEP